MRFAVPVCPDEVHARFPRTECRMPRPVEVAMAVGIALAPVLFASTEFALIAANEHEPGFVPLQVTPVPLVSEMTPVFVSVPATPPTRAPQVPEYERPVLIVAEVVPTP